MKQEQKRRPGNTKTLTRGEGKSIEHQRAVFLEIKDRKKIDKAFA